MGKLEATEFILNPTGSLYHLNLFPDQVATTILTVGDPDRVKDVSKHFDKVDFKIQKREFITHTGWIGNKRLTVISTGIGTDNIDIVLNELDALFNIDFTTREIKEQITQLDFIRIGTSGCLVPEFGVDKFLVSSFGFGFDNLMSYYDFKESKEEKGMQNQIKAYLKSKNAKVTHIPYIAKGSQELINKMGVGFLQGITLTCPGFYAPQGRQLRAKIKDQNWLNHFSVSELITDNGQPTTDNSHQITNFEMETAGIYGLSKMLGHRAISFNALLANRATKQFSENPKKTVEKLIKLVLERCVL